MLFRCWISGLSKVWNVVQRFVESNQFKLGRILPGINTNDLKFVMIIDLMYGGFSISQLVLNKGNNDRVHLPGSLRIYMGRVILRTLRPTNISVPCNKPKLIEVCIAESVAGSPGGVQVRRRPGQVGEAHPHLVSVTR
ncbi:hypothetical protein CDAR_535581 [Caerostris darwini]|uniref:Uncharacterized protein n=1 Tax=Caerostris darwini TaxID=1538125 RepID=A0AAV4QRB9_9ARAC|nr:hypothetical protein CDAR_535581 [Caerostris darwini]